MSCAEAAASTTLSRRGPSAYGAQGCKCFALFRPCRQRLLWGLADMRPGIRCALQAQLQVPKEVLQADATEMERVLEAANTLVDILGFASAQLDVLTKAGHKRRAPAPADYLKSGFLGGVYSKWHSFCVPKMFSKMHPDMRDACMHVYMHGMTELAGTVCPPIMPVLVSAAVPRRRRRQQRCARAWRSWRARRTWRRRCWATWCLSACATSRPRRGCGDWSPCMHACSTAQSSEGFSCRRPS